MSDVRCALAHTLSGNPQRGRFEVAAKNTDPIRSLDDLAADTFGSDEELDEFLAFTHAERQRDVLVGPRV